MKVKIVGKVPRKATEGSAGFDVHCGESVILAPSETKKIKTGIWMQLPDSALCMVCSRSGLASKGVVVVNSPGIIDSDYRGELCVLLRNLNEQPATLEAGIAICQLIFLNCISPQFVQVKELDTTQRGERGFGSTDEKTGN